MKKTTFKWLAALAGLAGLIALWAMAPLDAWVTALNAQVERLGLWGYLVFGLVYVVATVLMMPGSVLTLAAGLAFGLEAFFLVVVSAAIGACLAFLVGRYLARESIEKRFADSRRFRAIDHAVRDEGWQIVGLMRLSPLVPFNLQNYLFGLTDIRFGHYALAT
ncbi:MAG: VTT domain-containing protein, partial [Xanthomonadales bacterium]|nr:VTT domain-containing protein [Xanthomonadales bacterium]